MFACVNLDHLKVNVVNNIVLLFLCVGYLTQHWRPDNISNVDLQGRQHLKIISLYMCGQFFIENCTVTV